MKWERIIPWIEAHTLEIFLVGLFVLVVFTVNGL